MRWLKDRLVRACRRRLTRDRWHCAVATINFLCALREPFELVRSAIGLRRYQDAISRIGRDMPRTDNAQIPELIHFVFGLRAPEELPYYGYLAIKSAMAQHRAWAVVFHYHYEPTGPYWAAIKKEVVCVRVPQFTFYRFARLHHYAHKADVIRMLALYRAGGIYLDLDTICCRSFEPLRHNAFVMGVQATIPGAAGGLCNAVMASAPRARFLRIWLRRYASFRSWGRDALWDFHSVRLPVRLAVQNPELITVLPFNAFFYPLWPDLERILLAEDSGRYWHYLERSFAFHLWNNITSHALTTITEDFVQSSQSSYARIARSALELLDESTPGFDRCSSPQQRQIPALHAA